LRGSAKTPALALFSAGFRRFWQSLFLLRVRRIGRQRRRCGPGKTASRTRTGSSVPWPSDVAQGKKGGRTIDPRGRAGAERGRCATQDGNDGRRPRKGSPPVTFF